MTPIDSPAVLPDGVVQVSARIDLSGVDAPERRRLEFLAGRACAVAAIATLEPRRRTAVPDALPSGAPRFPSWLAGSITHAGGFVSAAVARRSHVEAIGIDSEMVAGRRRASRVMSRVAAAREVQSALRDTGLDRETIVTLLFSAKESLFKALHPIVRRPIDFLDARIEASGSGASGTLRAVLRSTLTDGMRRGAFFDGRFEIRYGYVHTGIVIPAR